MTTKPKILNLYSGIGGTIHKLNDYSNITNVDNNKIVLEINKRLHPGSTNILCDAKEYLIKNYRNFDIILASPPCQPNTRLNYTLNSQNIVRLPDLSIYEIVLFLEQFHKGLYMVENVISYFEPLIKPQILDRHFVWSNVKFKNIDMPNKFNLSSSNIKYLENSLGINLGKTKGLGKRKDQILRNCIHPGLGVQIIEQLNQAFDNRNFIQNKLF